MAGTDREVAENALRLIKKARSMNRGLAAIYLEPLVQLAKTSQNAGSAIEKLRMLLHELQTTSGDLDASWQETVSAVEAWRNAE